MLIMRQYDIIQLLYVMIKYSITLQFFPEGAIGSFVHVDSQGSRGPFQARSLDTQRMKRYVRVEFAFLHLLIIPCLRFTQLLFKQECSVSILPTEMLPSLQATTTWLLT